MSARYGKSGLTYYAILYAICYQFKNKKDDCQNEDHLKQDIEKIIFTILYQLQKII